MEEIFKALFYGFERERLVILDPFKKAG